jgi:uridylate kinase
MKLKYKRIMLKISGEALSAENGFGIDQGILGSICESVKEASDMGVEIAQ